MVFAIAASALVLKPLMRRTLAALGFRTVLVGNAVLAAAGAVALGLATPDTPVALLMIVVTAFGVVRSLQFNATNALLYADIPRERQAAGTALGGVGQQLAMALGISLAAALVAKLDIWGLVALPRGAMSVAFHAAAGLCLVSGLLFLRLSPSDGDEVSGHRPRAR